MLLGLMWLFFVLAGCSVVNFSFKIFKKFCILKVGSEIFLFVEIR